MNTASHAKTPIEALVDALLSIPDDFCPEPDPEFDPPKPARRRKQSKPAKEKKPRHPATKVCPGA